MCDLTGIYIKTEDAYPDYKDCIHSVTFTLSPEIYNKPIRQQLKKSGGISEGILCDILTEYCNKYIIVAELTKRAVVHYHCLLEYKDEYSEYNIIDSLKYKSKILGKPYMNQHLIRNKDEWTRAYNYITKELNKTHIIVNKNRLKVLPIIEYNLIDHYRKPSPVYKHSKLLDICLPLED